jgi:hypothetical protein
MNTKTHRAKNGGADQYFTRPADAAALIKLTKKFAPTGATWVEPSAGAGAFLAHAPHAVGYDLHPQHAGIVKLDWLTTKALDTVAALGAPVVVFGNPPFGFAASLAIKFFNQAALMGAETIAFILPASFKKASVHRRLHKCYTLRAEVSATLEFDFPDGGSKKVPCVSQVWTRGKARVDAPADNGKGLPIEFVSKDEATLAIRRVGGRAGQVLDGIDYSASTTFFIKCALTTAARIRRLDLTVGVNDTAGVRSLAKSELCARLRGAL